MHVCVRCEGACVSVSSVGMIEEQQVIEQHSG